MLQSLFKSGKESEQSCNLFAQHFPQSKERPILLIVIHCVNLPQTLENIERAQKCGADGVFLINHVINSKTLIEFYSKALEKFPNYWMGINALGEYPDTLFNGRFIPEELLGSLNGIWTDDSGVDERRDPYNQPYPSRVKEAMRKRGFKGLYFGGVAFKYQKQVTEFHEAAKSAAPWMDVITTSGSATGKAPNVDKIETMKSANNQHPVAIASGISEENVNQFVGFADVFLVASSVTNPDDEMIDEKKLCSLVRVVVSANKP